MKIFKGNFLIDQLGYPLFALGLAYLAALFIGRVVSKFHLPKVTGYLLVGLLLGPSFAKIFHFSALINEATADQVRVLSDIALALIMFTMGTQFKTESFRRWGKKVVLISAAEILATFLFVSIAIFLFSAFVVRKSIDPSLGVWGSALYFAVFIGIIAFATAPAATLLVIREYESDGPVTELVLALVGQNNLASIFAFNIATFFLIHAEGSLASFFVVLFGPIAIGIFTGFVISAWAQLLEKNVEIQLLLLGGIIANVGLAGLFHLDIFLICFFTGIVVTNASPKVTSVLDALRSIDYPLYVIFFIIAGASLHIEELSHLGLIGVVYIIMRTSGKLVGSWLGARLAGFGQVEQKWVGLAMLAQAGVAIGLSQTLANTWNDGGQMIQTIVLGSVVFFELMGPISVRHALVRAGEVPVLTLLAKRAPEGSFEGLHHVIDHFRASIGIPVHYKIESAADIMIKHIMRKNVDTVCENAAFNEILKLVSHSKYDRFPVTNKSNEFIGVIDYSDIRDVLFDPSLSKIIVARDIVEPEPITLFPEQTLGEALEIFQAHSDISYVPVLDSKNQKKLVGIVSQNDVLSTFRTISSKTK